MLDEAFRFLDHHLGHLHVAGGRLVEGRGHDFTAHRALHIGHFLGTLVDQKHDQIALGMIAGDRLRNVLQQDRLTRARRRNDERTLALAYGRDDIDDTRGHVLLRGINGLEL